MNVDTAKLRQFINDKFGPQDLNDLLFDYFRSVHEDLTPGMTKRQHISLLLEFCDRHGKFPDLLAAIGRERPFFRIGDYQKYTDVSVESGSFFDKATKFAEDFAKGKTAPNPAPPTPTSITRNPRQIFISHAHQDAEVAQRLAHDLEAHGYDIWIAPDSIRPGEKWVEAINRGLEESGIFVLLLSPDAVASRWVQLETNVAITYTHEDEMQLYPLMFKACHLPALWRAFQHISLRSSYDQGLDSLLVALAGQTESQSTNLTRTAPASRLKLRPESSDHENEAVAPPLTTSISRERSAIRPLDLSSRGNILDALRQYFNEIEFYDLLFDLRINRNSLGGGSLADQMRECVLLMEREARLAELVAKVLVKRPHLEWNKEAGSSSLPSRRMILIALRNSFDESEFYDLLFDLNVNRNSLGGDSLADQMRECILFMEREGRLTEFVAEMRKKRPNLNW